MGLSKGDVEKLIDKLQSQYAEYSKKYGSRWFNLESFKERYIMAIEHKMNLENFVLAEMDNIEMIIDKIEKKIDKKGAASRRRNRSPKRPTRSWRKTWRG